MIVRTIAEVLSRGVILRKTLPKRFGSLELFVTPEAGLRFWKPGLAFADPWLLEMVGELVHPGMHVWDIGANVGLFGIAAGWRAGSTGSVTMVEADPWLVTLCQRSAFSAGKHGVCASVLAVAAAERLGVLRFAVATRARASNHLVGYGTSQAGGVRYTNSTLSVTLDVLLDHCPAPSLVKIDVEGAEYAVLQGAVRLLAELKPKIMIEVGAENQDRVGRLLREYGYTL